MTEKTVAVPNTTNSEKEVVNKVSAEELQKRLASGGLENKTPTIRKIKHELGIGGQAKDDWDSIPSFKATYQTTIFNKKAGHTETTVIDIDHEDGVSTLSWKGAVFGKFVVSAYQKKLPIGGTVVEVLCGPNFVAVELDEDIRKNVYQGHNTPWLGFRAANIFSQYYYKRLMAMRSNGELKNISRKKKGLVLIEDKQVTVMPDIDLS